jgi:dTDP-glucose 4,6-dehydratase
MASNEMVILVYGANGWIGNQFTKILNDSKKTFIKGIARVDDENALKNEIIETKPTHVISLIGRTHGTIGEKKYTTIDYLEQKGKIYENVRDNLFSPLQLAMICKKLDVHYTYLGTGCIFEYDDDHPFGKEINGFTEESMPNFFGSSYSVVKGFTDRLFHMMEDNVLNLRIRMPINAENNPRNFITKIATYEKICSVPNSMSVLPNLLPYVVKMMEMKTTGTINLTNPGLISHNEILEMYRNIVDNSFKWKNFSIEEQSQILAAGRSNNYLDTIKLETLFPDVLNIKDAVRLCLENYPKKVTNNLWNDKMRILITGGCGFIGSNFVNYIMKKYPTIHLINLDALYYCADVNNVHKNIQQSSNYTFVHGNLCDMNLIMSVLNEYKCTHVIHFAAQSHVQNSFSESLQYTKDNIFGTHTLLEACRIYGKIKKFIHVSTDEVYGESLMDEDEMHKTEQSVLCPTNPYAATKAGAELLARSYIHSYKMPIIITRGNNVYGPNQYPEKLIPRFIEQLNNDEKVTVQGDGSNLRSFLHVNDTVTAFELIMEKGDVGEIYNIGCDDNMEYSVIDVSKLLIKMIKNTDNHDEWITYIEDRPFNDKRYHISNHKLVNLGWKINIKFIDGLRKLVDGYSKK